MNPTEVLFDASGHAIGPAAITKSIATFRNSYNNAVSEIISASTVLDDDGVAFRHCASGILSNFKMTRSGPFHEDMDSTIGNCWDAVGTSLVGINSAVRNSGLLREGMFWS